ncbi:cytochrome b5 isoform X2 [Colletes latitarsis]|uniref:cytochrome b5 isoform X2 n=1 Tax=Colletes latitarsis TaxID=2605962 RepID=UPI004036CC8E
MLLTRGRQLFKAKKEKLPFTFFIDFSKLREALTTRNMWFVRRKNMASENTSTDTTSTKFYTTAEVAEHTNSSSLWIIINNSVYDVTPFLTQHPGGKEILLDHAGRDSTEAFEIIGHSSSARLMMVQYKIGEILKEGEPEKTTESDAMSKENNSKKNMESENTATDTTKFYTTAEVAEHRDINSLWIIINNSVYDLTTFLNKHPGGPTILVDQAGRDSTEAFEDIGHSSDARLMMVPYKIGEILREEEPEKAAKSDEESNSSNCSGSWRSWLIPIALGILATLVYRYFIKAH